MILIETTLNNIKRVNHGLLLNMNPEQPDMGLTSGTLHLDDLT